MGRDGRTGRVPRSLFLPELAQGLAGPICEAASYGVLGGLVGEPVPGHVRLEQC